MALYSAVPINLDNIATMIGNVIKLRKMKFPAARRGVITEFRIPRKIRIEESSEVSAVYKGSVKSGYFTLLIVDRDGVKQWFEDCNSVDHKILDSGRSVQTGRLNFSNGRHESNWKFTPSRPLYAGYAKAIVHMFEDTNLYPLTFQEKDIHLV